MRAVDLNFAPAPFRNNTPYYLGYGLGAALIVLFSVYNSWAYFAYSRSSAELEHDYAANRAKLDSLRRDADDLQAKIAKVDLGNLNGRAVFTNGLLERRRFSWTDLLNSLEEAQVYQVRLLSLLPRISEKGIIIDARAVAHDLKSMWNFQQNLQIHPKFRRVYPGGWSKSTDEGEIVFNLAFNYFPQGAPEGAQGPTPQEANLPGFVEAPGPNGTDGDEVMNGPDDEPAQEEPPAPAKIPSTAKVRPKPGTPTLGDGRGQGGVGLAATSPPRTAAIPADSSGRKPLAPVGDPATLNPQVPAGAPGFRIAGSPTATGPTGASGATGATGAHPPRRAGRGLPPGSGGVRPPPPEKPRDLPTLPVPNSGATGDDE